MSREVRRVPLDWQPPMVWLQHWDRDRDCVVAKYVPVPLLPDTYATALADWESERAQIIAHEGFDWTFYHAYCLTGYKGRDDVAECTHPYGDDPDEQVVVRDDTHLEELLLASHAERKPVPADYMPDFSDVPEDRMGLMMFETCSEGTPMSPAFGTPEELARWLVDNRASAFGYSTATYEQWLSVCRGGWAPSMVYTPERGLLSGVAAQIVGDLAGGAA